MNETTIRALSHDARGISAIDGKTIFIDNALPEEKVSYKLIKKRSKYNEGIAEEIIQPSSDRVKPACEYFHICGGCSMQHLKHEAQIEFKQTQMLNHFKHFGQIEPKNIIPPLIGPVWNYRHKARLGVRYVFKKESVLVGFREKKNSFLVDMNDCKILAHPLPELIRPLRELIYSLDAKAHIPQIEVAMGDNANALIFRHLEPLNQSDLDKLIQFAKQHNIFLLLQPAGPDSIHTLWSPIESDYLSYTLKQQNLNFRFYTNEFSQVNPAMNELMVEQALHYLQPESHETILDLFCGVGNFSLPIAKHCKQETGIEGIDTMVTRAQQNAELNHITNTNFYCADLSKDISHQPWAKLNYDKIILDPPRSGAQEMMPYIGNSSAKKIIYISCNSATLARDCGILVNQYGFTLNHAGIMDMFPHTQHVEAMAVLIKQ